jgi:hypothetical protein
MSPRDANHISRAGFPPKHSEHLRGRRANAPLPGGP